MQRSMYHTGVCTDDAPEETTVSDRRMVTIPASLRRRLDIEAGDTFRWSINDEGASPWTSSGSATGRSKTTI